MFSYETVNFTDKTIIDEREFQKKMLIFIVLIYFILTIIVRPIYETFSNGGL